MERQPEFSKPSFPGPNYLKSLMFFQLFEFIDVFFSLQFFSNVLLYNYNEKKKRREVKLNA